MENYNGSGTGTGKYTLDDLNEATGVTSSTKSSAAQFDRGQGNPKMSAAANQMLGAMQNQMSSQMKERMVRQKEIQNQ
jgi:hypothetical protein